LNLREFVKTDVIDCHVHLWLLREKIDNETLTKQGNELLNVINDAGLNKMNIFGDGGDEALYLKAANINKFYAGGYAPWSSKTKLFNSEWDEYIPKLIDLGYDGVGEMGSKPIPRKNHTPLDSEYYREFWKACEDNNFPVLCHIGDVEDFWHEEKTPAWAKIRDWGYWRGDYPSLDELYLEIENVLKRHPALKIVLCHFLFMSPDLERISEFLDNYPTSNLDLSLGVELMYNISRRVDDYRDFFKNYANRLLFGTDIGMSTTLHQHLARIWMIRHFLESSKEFYTPDEADELLTRYAKPFIGLSLPRGLLEKIYAGNFRRMWGEPRPIDLEELYNHSVNKGNIILSKVIHNLLQRYNES
jgi:predicted TIM-barrel fold metal-dependent hydrolase